MKFKSFKLASFKAAEDPKGQFEAIVAVFNNVDRGGDVILPGAFADSLADWRAKGRPIPVIFSHQWENLDAHIGQVLEAKETDEGLYVKAQLDMDEPFAQRVYKKMQSGTLAEFSFAYDIVDMASVKKDSDWVWELRKLDLLEVGPCLVGMNPDTELLTVKAMTKSQQEAFKAVWKAQWIGRNAEDYQMLHDVACELGAKCAHEPHGNEGEAPPQKGKPKKRTLADQVADEMLKAGVLLGEAL